MSFHEKIAKSNGFFGLKREERRILLPGETRESRDITLTPGILTNTPTPPEARAPLFS
jgi:hypothetical protein